MNSKTAAQFIRFGLVGAAGFLVDAVVLMVALNKFGLGFYLGRLLSYLCAATATWALNRRYTFQNQNAGRFRQWLGFLSVNATGGAINYGIYSLLVTKVSIVAAMPTLGVAAGSVAGLGVNFLLSRQLIFKSAPPSNCVENTRFPRPRKTTDRQQW